MLTLKVCGLVCDSNSECCFIGNSYSVLVPSPPLALILCPQRFIALGSLFWLALFLSFSLSLSLYGPADTASVETHAWHPFRLLAFALLALVANFPTLLARAQVAPLFHSLPLLLLTPYLHRMCTIWRRSVGLFIHHTVSPVYSSFNLPPVCVGCDRALGGASL